MAQRTHRVVNNDVYDTLGDRWYDADDDPVALLRAQARLHAPWICDELARAFGGRPCRVLDLACGGGFIANELARRGHEVVGVDISEQSLRIASSHDTSRRVRYVPADARALPMGGASFDAVCAMDFLEHVEVPDEVVAEAARVLAPRGLFMFHTFDRNPISWLLVIQGVQWFVRNVPRELHVHRLFVTPDELRAICAARGLVVRQLRGCEPVLSRAFWRMLATGVVPRDFAFRFTRWVYAGYTGIAEKTP